jgi:hypothetical protein
MVQTAIQILMLLLPLVQSASMPLLIGALDPQLTTDDVAALEMVLPAKPWLLYGSRIQFGGAKWVQSFLPPTVETKVLRRGTIVYVERGTNPMGIWVVQRTESYAQVAIPGRAFNDIRDDHDINRPFRVIGRFEDDELVSLVEFLRSPRSHPAERWPIGSIKKADGSVEVELMETASRGQWISLRKSGQDWVIYGLGGWAA